MITIRSASMAPIISGDARTVLPARAARLPVERVDIYPCPPSGPALLGVAWPDGSTGMCSWTSARDCVRWVMSQAWARPVLVHHADGRESTLNALASELGVTL